MKRDIKIEFSDQELNYIDSALARLIAERESGSQLGNARYLLWFTKRLRGRLRRLHTTSYRLRMGERKWKAHRERVNRIIREARRPKEKR